MAEHALELEGTWEEIMGRAAELAGRRVRLIVLPGEPDGAPGGDLTRTGHDAMLELLEEWQHTPLTDEEQEILEGFGEFRKQHPVRIRPLEDR